MPGIYSYIPHTYVFPKSIITNKLCNLSCMLSIPSYKIHENRDLFLSVLPLLVGAQKIC